MCFLPRTLVSFDHASLTACMVCAPAHSNRSKRAPTHLQVQDALARVGNTSMCVRISCCEHLCPSALSSSEIKRLPTHSHTQDVLARVGTIPEDILSRITAKILVGLTYLHRQKHMVGVIYLHRSKYMVGAPAIMCECALAHAGVYVCEEQGLGGLIPIRACMR